LQQYYIDHALLFGSSTLFFNGYGVRGRTFTLFVNQGQHIESDRFRVLADLRSAERCRFQIITFERSRSNELYASRIHTESFRPKGDHPLGGILWKYDALRKHFVSHLKTFILRV